MLQLDDRFEFVDGLIIYREDTIRTTMLDLPEFKLKLNRDDVMNFFTGDSVKKLNRKLEGDSNIYASKISGIVGFIEELEELKDKEIEKRLTTLKTNIKIMINGFRELIEMTRNPKKMEGKEKTFSAKISIHYTQIQFMSMFYILIRKNPPKKILKDELALEDLMTVMKGLREQLIMVQKLYNPKTTDEFIKNIDSGSRDITEKYAEKIFK